jgi:chemosensory pili system protein ChpE
MTASLFFWAFGLSLAYSLLPGAVMIETMRRGTLGGFQAAVRVRVGALLGSLAWAGLALSGAGLFLQQTPVQLIVGVLGAALLLRMAWSALVPARAVSCAGATAVTGRGDVLCGLGFALTNPLGCAFWLGMSGQIALAAPSDQWLSGAGLFLAGYIAGHLLYTIVFAGVIAWGQRRFGSGLLRWANPVGGVTLTYFGLHLLARTVQLA